MPGYEDADVVSARQFDDQIGLCGAPIEDHHGGAGTGTTWAYLAGRCFSATHDAHASVRSMAQCVAMGQAAGTAAALAAAADGEVRSVPVGRLLDRLRAAAAVLGVDGRRIVTPWCGRSSATCRPTGWASRISTSTLFHVFG